jgi:hypothetical protein
MELERQPGHVDQAFPFQLLDSDRVDVAPGSNVIGEDDQLHRLDCLSHHFRLIVRRDIRFHPVTRPGGRLPPAGSPLVLRSRCAGLDSRSRHLPCACDLCGDPRVVDHQVDIQIE